MKDFTSKDILTPVARAPDPLTELLRKGAKELISAAVESELQSMAWGL